MKYILITSFIIVTLQAAILMFTTYRLIWRYKGFDVLAKMSYGSIAKIDWDHPNVTPGFTREWNRYIRPQRIAFFVHETLFIFVITVRW